MTDHTKQEIYAIIALLDAHAKSGHALLPRDCGRFAIHMRDIMDINAIRAVRDGGNIVSGPWDKVTNESFR